MANDVRAKLAAPISGFKWRLQQTKPKNAKGADGKYQPGTRGMFMAYIDARDLYDRLDDVFGIGGWQRTVVAVNPDGSVIGRLSVKIGEEWVHQDDIGYSNDPGAPHEKEPLKAAASDAFKRAGVGLGIGRFLYELDAKWVAINEWGQPLAKLDTGEIEDHEPHEQPNLPARDRSTSVNTIPAESESPDDGEAGDWTTFWNEARAAGLKDWPAIASALNVTQDDFRNAGEALKALRAKTQVAV